ncbi:MAG: DUF4384 domain-containing protein [Ideonella sp.]|nr:DUF4384 domain-containing protein [Ideonella sp.]
MASPAASSAPALVPPALSTQPFSHAAGAAPASLTIVGLAVDGRTGTTGAAATTPQRFRAGERIQLRVTPSRDAYVYCYLQDETRSVQRFFPNRFHASALARAGEPLEIPGRMRFELVVNSRRVTETVACFASERDPAGTLPSEVIGQDFTKLAGVSLDDLRRAFARPGAAPLAEARFQIEPR